MSSRNRRGGSDACRLGLSGPVGEQGDTVSDAAPGWRLVWAELYERLRQRRPRGLTRIQIYAAIVALPAVGRVGHYVRLVGHPDVEAVKRRIHLGHIAWRLKDARERHGEGVVSSARKVKRSKDAVVAFRRQKG